MNHSQIIFKPAQRWLIRGKNYLWRILIIGVILLSSAVLAPQIVSDSHKPMLVFMLYAGLASTLILLRWPALGLFLVIVGGMFIRFSGPGGLNIALLTVALLSGIWFLKMIIEDKKIIVVPSRPILPLMLFMLVSLISFGIGQFPWYPFARQAPLDAQVGGLAIFLLSAGAFLLVAHLVPELRWLEWLTWLFIALGAFYVTGRLVRWGGIDLLYHRGFSAGSMFWTWFVSLAFGQAALNKNMHMRWRIILGGLVIATFYVAYVQGNGWKSGWIPPLVALAAILVVRYWRPALFLAPFGLIPAYFLANQLIGSEQYSWGTRLDAWSIVTEIVKVNPVLGLGFANYYWYTPLFPIRGYYVQFNSHSQYLDLLAQTGIIGLVCFVWFFWEVGRLGWRLRDRVPAGFARAYVYGALGGLVGTLFAAALVDWVLPFVYNIGMTGFRASVLPWLFMGGLVSLERIYRIG
jgi:hypothetical protein